MKTIKHYRFLAIVLPLLIVLGGCAHWRPQFEQPTVKVVTLRALPAEGMEQRFAIGLRITNPNSVPLNLAGMSYRLRLNSYDLLSGVASDIPSIAPYSEIPLEVSAGINLLNSLRLVRSLMARPDEAIAYELSVKLETTSRLLPMIRLQEAGEIKLSP